MFALQRFGVLAILGLALGPALAQEPEVGDLLIAGASLDDPNFERTVLLIVLHSENGTIGVALNRPTWIAPAEAFPDAAALDGYTGALFFGGPAASAQPLMVFERGQRMPQSSQHILGSIYISDDLSQLAEFDLTAEDAPRVRIFAGHATWAPGQLAREIASGDWRTARARPDQIFAEEPARLWERAPSSGDAVTASLH